MTEDRRTANAGKSRLTVIPCDLIDANEFVRRHHRHHQPIHTHKFSLAVIDDAAKVRGVAVVNRPAARMIDDGLTAEVARVATDGCDNACSALYAAAWRAARGMGYRRLITYVLGSEPGTSLRAAGWRCTGSAGGGSWSRPSRPREDKHPLERKQRWEIGTDEPCRIDPDFGHAAASGQLSLFEVPA